MRRFITVVAAILAMAAVSSCAVDESTARAPLPRPTPDPVAVELAVDEVHKMEPGGSARFAFDFGDERWRVIHSDHILRAEIPGGWADLFTARLVDPDGQLQYCSAVRLDVDNVVSSGVGCGVDPLRTPNSPLTMGATSDGYATVYHVVVPWGTTHLIAEIADRRIAVIPVDGYALVWAASCLDSLSAWRDGQRLMVEVPDCVN